MNFRFSTRIVIGFMICSSLIVLSAIIGIFAIQRVNDITIEACETISKHPQKSKYEQNKIASVVKSSRMIIIICAILACSLCTLMALMLSRILTIYLNQIKEKLEELLSGNSSVDYIKFAEGVESSNDEVVQIAIEINKLIKLSKDTK
jgi:signal transduction histidine kinase